MDEFIQGLITGAPNLAVALLVLWWQHRRINALQNHILEQNRRLLNMPEKDPDETL